MTQNVVVDSDRSPGPEPAAPMNYAGFWRRFGAALADAVVVAVAVGLVGAGFEAFGVMFFETVEVRQAADGVVDFEARLDTTGSIVAIVLTWLYFALMESGPWQATPGKRLLGLRVTDLEGRRIGFGRATGRYLAKYISTAIVMLGWVMAGLTARKQALHDMIANCLVLARTP
ncbi:MAG: RDD family protein [Alphaproteobacteria bacterium]